MDLVTFTEEILNGKLHFLRRVLSKVLTMVKLRHILYLKELLARLSRIKSE